MCALTTTRMRILLLLSHTSQTQQATRSEKVAALRALAEIDPLRARSFIEEAAHSEDPLLASAAAKQFNKRGPNR